MLRGCLAELAAAAACGRPWLAHLPSAAASLAGSTATCSATGSRLQGVLDAMASQPRLPWSTSQSTLQAGPSSRGFAADAAAPQQPPAAPGSGEPQQQPQPAQQPQPSLAYGPRKVTMLRGRGALGGDEGIVHIQNTLNNIIISLTDKAGNVRACASAGSMGFRNARKSLPVAAERAAEDVAKKALKLGYNSVVVRIKGMGTNKQYAVQSLHAAGLAITQLQDVTPVPYNGCRRPKKRRV